MTGLDHDGAEQGAHESFNEAVTTRAAMRPGPTAQTPVPTAGRRLTPKSVGEALKSFGVTLDEAMNAGILDELNPDDPDYIMQVHNAAQAYKLSLRDPNEPNILAAHRGQVRMGGKVSTETSWSVDGYKAWAVERDRIMTTFKISDRETTAFVKAAHGGKTANEFENGGGTFEQSVQAMELCALTWGREKTPEHWTDDSNVVSKFMIASHAGDALIYDTLGKDVTTWPAQPEAMKLVKAALDQAAVTDGELPWGDEDLKALEAKASTLPKIEANEGQGSTEGPKEASTPTDSKNDVVEAEFVDETLTPLMLTREKGDQNGKEYVYDAAWTPETKQWKILLETYVKTWTDEEREERNNVVAMGLTAQRPGEIVIIGKIIDAPVELVNKLRTEADKAIKEAWPELDSKERDNDRIEHLKAAWSGSQGQGTAGALTTFGYQGAKKLVLAYCMKHTQEETEKMAARHEEESKALETIPQQTVTNATAALTVLSPNSPIKVPTEAEWRLMERFATFAVRCKIYPNDSAAFLAIYRGFELGFGISTSIENIYAFEGKGGKIMTMPSAHAYTAICLASPVCERFSVFNDTEESAVAIVKRRGMPEITYRYTKADAQTARLLDKPAWQTNMKSMLRNRVARSSAELTFADVCAAMGLGLNGGMDEELADAGDLPQAAGF